MNKKTTTSLLLMFAAATLAAEASQISPRQAEAIASQFANSTPRLKAYGTSHSAAAMKVAYTKMSATDGENLLHVVNRGDDGGYVVVAGDDAAPNVVLGYSTGGTFDYETAPENLRWWLDEYGRQMEYMIENGITASEQASAPTFDRNVEPMVTTRWNQDAPYNNMCPTLNGLRTYTGKIALQSFNYGAVRYCRRNTDLPCGQLCTWRNPSTTGRSHLTDFMGKLWINKLSKPHFIAYDVRDLEDNPYIVNARKKLPVITWTVNSAEKLERAEKFADNIIFEDICELVESRYIPAHKAK